MLRAGTLRVCTGMRSAGIFLAAIVLFVLASPLARADGKRTPKRAPAPAHRTNLMVAEGLGADLALATGGAPFGNHSHAAVGRSIEVRMGYGVELVSVSGPVGVGMFVGSWASPQPATVNVFNQATPVLPTEIDGPAAERLFDAMTAVPIIVEKNLYGSLRRTSPGKRIDCIRPPHDGAYCAIGGVLSVSTGP